MILAKRVDGALTVILQPTHISMWICTAWMFTVAADRAGRATVSRPYAPLRTKGLKSRMCAKKLGESDLRVGAHLQILNMSDHWSMQQWDS